MAEAEEKSTYKWICTVQICVTQGPTVLDQEEKLTQKKDVTSWIPGKQAFETEIRVWDVD